ncbi:hypothetical protein BaRGS_00008157 [Batillaria attramentaria]|uniref:Uncharacterized protein n=1 Tax=Batillaria attramentaria TaxID=370345 RepID=A0ABD0LLV6_9CAEN
MKQTVCVDADELAHGHTDTAGRGQRPCVCVCPFASVSCSCMMANIMMMGWKFTVVSVYSWEGRLTRARGGGGGGFDWLVAPSSMTTEG